MAGVLDRWCHAGPVAIIQALPYRLWNRCAAAFTPVQLSRTGPSYANADLAVQRRPGQSALPRLGRPVPVLDLRPAWLANWAALVADPPHTAIDAVVIGTERLVRAAGTMPHPSTVTSPEELVGHFRAGAPADVYRLACYLAAVPLSLPVMHLVQTADAAATPRPATWPRCSSAGCCRAPATPANCPTRSSTSSGRVCANCCWRACGARTRCGCSTPSPICAGPDGNPERLPGAAHRGARRPRRHRAQPGLRHRQRRGPAQPRRTLRAPGRSSQPPRAGALSPVCLAGLPVGAPRDHRPSACSAWSRRSRCRSSIPIRDERGWAFREGPGTAAIRSAASQFLSEAYLRTDPTLHRPLHRAVHLGSRHRPAGHEQLSRHHDRLRDRSFTAYHRAGRARPVSRVALRAEIDAINALVYEDVNNGVYKAGFAAIAAGLRGGGDRAVRAAGLAGGAAGAAALPRRRRS